MSGSVDILLATYNGARYLPALLASLEAQSVAGFRILAADDGSTDATAAILAQWAERVGPYRMSVLTFAGRAGGARGNFARLLAASDADYVLFADQDDVWHPTKLARTLDGLRALEQQHGREQACLAFCDLRVVDADLTVRHPSLWGFQGLDVVAGLRPRHLLMENVVTGCAMGINAAARRLALPIPDAAVMHDWWLALVCVLAGHVTVLPDALIDYRQHGGNDVGASQWSLLARLRLRLRAGSTVAGGGYGQFLKQRLDQAAALHRHLAGALSPAAEAALRDFATLPARSWLSRRLTALRHGFGPKDPRKRIGFLLRL